MYYQNTDAAVVVFDLGDEETFKGATKWVQELDKFMDSKVPIAIAGNKADLPARVVTLERVNEFVEKNNAKFFFTSAQTGENVSKPFEYLAEEIFNRKPKPKVTGKKLVVTSKKRKPCC
eukprot:TRINITY_DN3025_c0_g1_i1.p1 TRINITY_DN3025_c0_g1~~TRINITY_DN3025_c0_g1_i1.p1  ORF type:complete len:119 (-),score=45.51 TRINITY_DN3025_c0_g1_i1:105-461(-)